MKSKGCINSLCPLMSVFLIVILFILSDRTTLIVLSKYFKGETQLKLCKDVAYELRMCHDFSLRSYDQDQCLILMNMYIC